MKNCEPTNMYHRIEGVYTKMIFYKKKSIYDQEVSLGKHPSCKII
jgi:hypothetical protein